MISIPHDVALEIGCWRLDNLALRRLQLQSGRGLPKLGRFASGTSQLLLGRISESGNSRIIRHEVDRELAETHAADQRLVSGLHEAPVSKLSWSRASRCIGPTWAGKTNFGPVVMKQNRFLRLTHAEDLVQSHIRLDMAAIAELAGGNASEISVSPFQPKPLYATLAPRRTNISAKCGGNRSEVEAIGDLFG